MVQGALPKALLVSLFVVEVFFIAGAQAKPRPKQLPFEWYHDAGQDARPRIPQGIKDGKSSSSDVQGKGEKGENGQSSSSVAQGKINISGARVPPIEYQWNHDPVEEIIPRIPQGTKNGKSSSSDGRGKGEDGKSSPPIAKGKVKPQGQSSSPVDQPKGKIEIEERGKSSPPVVQPKK